MLRLALLSILLPICAALLASSVGCAGVSERARVAAAEDAFGSVLEAYEKIKTYQADSTFFINAREQKDMGTLMLNSWATRFDRASGCLDVESPQVFRFVQNQDAAFIILQSAPVHFLQHPRAEPLAYGPIRALLKRVQNGNDAEIPLVAPDLMLLLDGNTEVLAPGAQASILQPGSKEVQELRAALTSGQTAGPELVRNSEFQAYQLESKRGPLNLLVDAQTHLIVAAIMDVDSAWLGFPPGIPLRLYQVCSNFVINAPLEPSDFSVQTDGLTKVESDEEFARLVPKMEGMEESHDK